MAEEKVYKGLYSIYPCAHGCGRRLELGPRLLAKWGWCAVCQAPTCMNAVCTSKCPNWFSGWARWDQSEFKDFVADTIQADVDKRWNPKNGS